VLGIARRGLITDGSVKIRGVMLKPSSLLEMGRLAKWVQISIVRGDVLFGKD
jgi:hypothetical protein